MFFFSQGVLQRSGARRLRWSAVWGAWGTVIGHTGVAVSRARFISRLSWEQRSINNLLLVADQSLIGPEAAGNERRVSGGSR